MKWVKEMGSTIETTAIVRYMRVYIIIYWLSPADKIDLLCGAPITARPV